MPESGFANKIYEVKDQYPTLWFKTHPRRAADNRWVIELHISTFISNESILDELKTIYHRLREYVVDNKGMILEENPPPTSSNF